MTARLVRGLMATNFVSRGGGVAKSFLVLYLTQDRGIAPATAGAVIAMLGVGDIGSQLLGGWLGDRIGRRQTMLIGFLGTTVALIALGLATTLPAICAAVLGVGLLAELFRPVAFATLADLPPQERLSAFGLLFWAANVGTTVATVAAGVLVRQGFGILFWINAGAALVAAVIVWFCVPETRPVRSTGPRRALLPVLFRDPVMLAMTAIHIVYFATFVQVFSTLPLIMTSDGLSPSTYAAALALNGIVIITVQPLAVRLLKGRDAATALAVSMLLVGIGGGLTAVVQGGGGYAAAILVWTLGQIGTSVLFGATFASLAPADLRGRYMGVANTTWSVGAVLGPLLGTALLVHAGRTTIWLTSSAIGLVLAIAMWHQGGSLRARAAAKASASAQSPTQPTSTAH